MSTPEAVRRAHDHSYFDNYGSGSAFDHHRVIDARKRVQWIGPGHGQRLLEIGSAAGHFLVEAKRAEYDPVGIEQSAYAVQNGVADGIPVHVGLVEEAPLESASFDVVCAWHVIEHLTGPVQTVSRLAGALRPGGRIFVEVPNFAGVNAQRLGLAWPHLDPEHHVGFYSPKSIRALLEHSGFRDIRTTTVSGFEYMTLAERLSPVIAARWARHALLNRTVRTEHPVRLDLLRAVALR